MSEPLVSVVTPVYNTAEYLEEAMRSVLAQTYGNFEYVVCNNHSTDGSLDIARRFAAVDARIRIVQPPTFLPQGQNFNFALQQIAPSSRYTKMLLADDWLFPRCLEEMLACGDAHPSAGLIGSYRLEETDVHSVGLRVEQTLLQGRSACRHHLLHNAFLFGTPSTVMYRSDVVRARSPRFFPDDRIFFDTEAAFQILADHDLGFVHQILSFSRAQPGALTDRLRRFNDRFMDRLVTLYSYGPQHLSSEEYERQMARCLRVFYEGLGRQWLKERFGEHSKEFWDFQQRGLSGIGLEVEPARLALGVSSSVLRTLSSPLDLVRDYVRKRRVDETP